ncbi:hypothetical protein [Streptomyces abikoensis]
MSERVINVYADRGWQDTGFELPPGFRDTVGWSLRAEGTWCFDTSARDYATRDAAARKPNDSRFYDASTVGRTEYLYHGEGGQVGQLIGRCGRNGGPFVVGRHALLQFLEPGQPMQQQGTEGFPRIELIEALAARPDIVSASRIADLEATDDSHLCPVARRLPGQRLLDDHRRPGRLHPRPRRRGRPDHGPPARAERLKALGGLLPPDPPEAPPMTEAEVDGGPRTLWLAMNDVENGFHDNDGYLVVSIKAYDRT